MTDRRVTDRSVVAAGRDLRVLLMGAEPPRPGAGRRRLAVEWALALAGAAYLAYGGSVYLDLKSGLPLFLCLIGGVALAVPLALVVTRPLLAWRAAWVAAIVTGAAVQAHDRTPFSWHPAVFAAQLLILVVVALRVPPGVSAWALVSMAALICVSFYPADRVQLIVIVAGLMGIAGLIRHGRRRAALKS
jgi:hypothetical protein